MQDALTIAFDITAVTAAVYLSTEFCLGLAERVSHPKPTPVTLPASSPMAAAPVTGVPADPAVSTVPTTPAPSTPIAGTVQPLPTLSAVPKPEPEYLPLNPQPTQPNPLVED